MIDVKLWCRYGYDDKRIVEDKILMGHILIIYRKCHLLAGLCDIPGIYFFEMWKIYIR